MAAPTKTVGGVLLPESATAGKVRRECGALPEARLENGGPAAAPSLALLALHRTQTHKSTLSLPNPHSQLAEGKVLAVGPGRRVGASAELVAPAVKEGDTVLLPEYGGQQLKLEGKE
jgi:co-chaperonin GroES (HSP10)